MKFKKVTIENFKSIGSNPITVNLDFNGTKLLLGPNGSGKSSIIESIIWCIYGVSKLKADNVVNKSIGSGTKVEIEFSEGKHNYVITRYRKHITHKNNLYVFEDGNNITLKNPSDNQELVQKIVGIDSKAFLSSIILSSETYKQFLRETNSVRLQIFESVFSLKEINDLSKINKQKLKEIEKQIVDKKSEITSINAFIESDTLALKSYKSNYDLTLKNIDDQINKAINENAEYEKYLESQNIVNFDEEMKKATEYQINIAKYNNSKNDLELLNTLLESQQNDYNIIEKKILEAEDFIKAYPQSEIKKQIGYISDYNKSIEEINCIDKEITELQDRFKVLDSENKLYNNKLEIVKNKIDVANKQIEQINNDICPVCGNHIDSEHSKTILEEQSVIISKCNIELLDIQNKIDKNLFEMSDIPVNITSLESKRSAINCIEPEFTLEEIKNIIEKLKLFASDLPKYKIDLADKSSQMQTTKTKIIQINIEEPEKPNYSVDAINKIQTNIIDIRAKIESNKRIIENAESTKKSAFDAGYVSKTVSAIKDRQKNINKLNSDLFVLRKDYAEYQVLDEVFSNGDNGFKKYFINKTISLFNEKVNTFLPFFFDDEIEIKFDKDLNDSIMFRSKEADFEELSSGEKTRCELCIVFSLYFMVQSLFGCGTNLLAIDEILDTALDSAGIMVARKILDDIAKNTSVFVISHREELKESFSHIIEVQKDSNGFTKLLEK